MIEKMAPPTKASFSAPAPASPPSEGEYMKMPHPLAEGGWARVASLLNKTQLEAG